MPISKAQREKLRPYRWKRSVCLDTADGGSIVDVCNELGVSKTTFTPKVIGVWGTPEVVYRIDGDARKFRAFEEFVSALEERGII